MIHAAILAAALGAASAPVELSALTEEIDTLVLSGQSIPPDFLLRLRGLPTPGQRMQAITYLRRAGLLTGPEISLEDYVFDAPAATPSVSDPAVPSHEEAR